VRPAVQPDEALAFELEDDRHGAVDWAYLIERLRRESVASDRDNLCRGGLLSRRQYLLDLNELGMRDARLQPDGAMTREEIDKWTEADEVAE